MAAFPLPYPVRIWYVADPMVAIHRIEARMSPSARGAIPSVFTVAAFT